MLGNSSARWWTWLTGVSIAAAAPACNALLGNDDARVARDASVTDAAPADAPTIDSGHDVGASRDAGRDDTDGPVTLDDAEGTPRAIVTHGGELYWVDADGGSVRTMHVDGGGLKTLVPGVPSPLDIAISGSGILYWSSHTQTTPVDQCLVWSARAGSSDARCVVVDSYTPLRMALTASFVVLTVGAGTGAPLVGYWSQVGSSVGAIATDPTPQSAQAVAANDFQVYFGDGKHVDTDSYSSTGLGTGTAVCNTDPLCNVSDQMVVMDIVLDDSGGAYWTTTGTSAGSPIGFLLERQLGLTPGAVEMIGSVFPGTPRRLALDTRNVYMTVVAASGGSGAILAAPLSGTSGLRTVADAGCTPFGIATDGVRVYWTCDEGMIRSAPVPP